ncbi:MAG: HAD hydrolase-like protein [Clostridia bacterium]|nr:HAD hydrolase-like protein [Clostridia bacterium]
MTELPTQSEYALWAYDGCGFENCWHDFEEFYEDYKYASQALREGLPEDKEYELFRRFEAIVKLRQLSDSADEVAQSLYNNYWKTYSAKCYVKSEIRLILEQLSKKFKLAVVSNFMVSDGIEELLERNQISEFFQFVVTSVNVGWRKPHESIYNCAIEKAGVRAQKIAFIGDDYICDYVGPGKLGLQTIFYDKNNLHMDIKSRVSCLSELKFLL